MNPFEQPNPFISFHRDSRRAFGHRFQVERPSRDWIWGVASLTAACFAVVLMAGQI